MSGQAGPADAVNRPGRREQRLRAVAFVLRCTGATTFAYELTATLGLPKPVWAAISALVVSQARLDETRSSLVGRIAGTLLGIAVAVAVHAGASGILASVAEQIAVSVAITAVVAYRFESLRVAMWTCPLVLLTVEPSVPIYVSGFHRASEVILGAIVGWVFHWAAEIIVGMATREPPQDTKGS